ADSPWSHLDLRKVHEIRRPTHWNIDVEHHRTSIDLTHVDVDRAFGRLEVAPLASDTRLYVEPVQHHGVDGRHELRGVAGRRPHGRPHERIALRRFDERVAIAVPAV